MATTSPKSIQLEIMVRIMFNYVILYQELDIEVIKKFVSLMQLLEC